MAKSPVVLVSTQPFGVHDRLPIELIDGVGAELRLNPHARRMTSDELAVLIEDVDYLIAGTEPITAQVMDRAKNLKLIARVGIGLDSVDLKAARERGIDVTYTPDAPSPAVSELTLGLMLSLLRGTPQNDRALRDERWERFMGRRLSNCTVGVIGVGRIGKGLIRHIVGAFPSAKILANDLEPDLAFGAEMGIEWVEKDELYACSDIVTLHVPLTRLTRMMIGAREFGLMNNDAIFINTARGGMVDEDALADALQGREIAAAAMDVFVEEPYRGPLSSIDNVFLTCHLGSMTQDCRSKMEIEATQEVVRAINGGAYASPVPEFEYE